MSDTPQTRRAARARNYRHPQQDGFIFPSEKAQERYPVDQYPCSRCTNPKEGLPHLIDNGSEFYWHHQHKKPGSSARSGCPRFGGLFCGDVPRPGTATSLFEVKLTHTARKIYVARSEKEYLAAQQAVEEEGADDGYLRRRY